MPAGHIPFTGDQSARERRQLPLPERLHRPLPRLQPRSAEGAPATDDEPHALDRIAAEVQALATLDNHGAERERRPFSAFIGNLTVGFRIAFAHERLGITRSHAALGLRTRIGAREAVDAAGEHEDDEPAVAHQAVAPWAAALRRPEERRS